jgi:hypothetical protein
MRTTHSFLLRLLIDSDDPSALRGVIRSIVDANEQPFGDAQELIAALRQMIRLAATVSNTEPFRLESSFKENHDD